MDLKLNYQLKSPEERVSLVKQILSQTPREKQTPRYIEYLSDYILKAVTDQAKKTTSKRDILTDNRLVTINKRETSYEGLILKLEGGEDSLYNMLSDNPQQFLTQKDPITPQDLIDIPELAELRKSIEQVSIIEKNARGRDKYIAKKWLIELYQQQYTIKSIYRKTIYPQKVLRQASRIAINEQVTINQDDSVSASALLTLFNPKHVSLLLCNYSELKQENEGNFSDDMYYLLLDLENAVDAALKDTHPLYYDLLIAKIDGLTNAEIQQLLLEKHGIKHSVEYISCLWRNKIPKLIAEKAQEDYLLWYYENIERGVWKKCSRCGQVKLASNRFFSKNNTSKDGLYSICKQCRNTKNALKKEKK